MKLEVKEAQSSSGLDQKISTLRMLFFGEGQKRDERINGQTHIGRWVENVMNGRSDERMGEKRGHTHI